MRIGVFGGTFDPIHLGHLTAAREVLVQQVVDNVLFVPAGQPWLKADQPVTEAARRLAMVREAIEDTQGFAVTDIDVVREGPTYTVDMLRELLGNYGEKDELVLVLGTDALVEIERWRKPEQVFGLARVVAVARPGFVRTGDGSIGPIVRAAEDRLTWVSGAFLEISGTEIRARVAEGWPIEHLVPASVARYIADHALYRRR